MPRAASKDTGAFGCPVLIRLRMMCSVPGVTYFHAAVRKTMPNRDASVKCAAVQPKDALPFDEIVKKIPRVLSSYEIHPGWIGIAREFGFHPIVGADRGTPTPLLRPVRRVLCLV